ncbi:MAG: hypothetical protein JWQ71_158 [Pedosphaera sp.]|nr:hypothetical protein [Pedosphaera sp.]
MDKPTETESERKRSGGLAHWVSWSGVVLLLYVLSYGPVAGIVFRRGGAVTPRTARALIIIYTPVYWLSDQTPLKKPLQSYVGWWMDFLDKKE